MSTNRSVQVKIILFVVFCTSGVEPDDAGGVQQVQTLRFCLPPSLLSSQFPLITGYLQKAGRVGAEWREQEMRGGAAERSQRRAVIQTQAPIGRKFPVTKKGRWQWTRVEKLHMVQTLVVFLLLLLFFILRQ